MRAAEVLDAQADLLDRLTDPTFRGYITGWATAEIERPGVDMDQVKTDDRLIKSLTAQTRAAYAYRVTHDMSKLVEWTAAQLDDTDRFHRDLTPTGCGIVGFDRPLPVTDIRGRTMLVHWLIWGPGAVTDPTHTGAGVAVWTFNDVWRQPDQTQKAIEQVAGSQFDVGTLGAFRRKTGRWAPVSVNVFLEGQRVGSALIKPSADQVTTYSKGLLDDPDEPVPGSNMLRYVQALLMLFGQTITTVEDDPVDRAAKRRAVKAGLPGKVTVIRLRRADTPREPGETHVEWSHRWIVRQHWRWAPYGRRKDVDHVHVYGDTTVEAGKMTRYCTHEGCDARLGRIIVQAHVKGPEGAPLVQSDKVYDLAR